MVDVCQRRWIVQIKCTLPQKEKRIDGPKNFAVGVDLTARKGNDHSSGNRKVFAIRHLDIDSDSFLTFTNYYGDRFLRIEHIRIKHMAQRFRIGFSSDVV